MESAKSKTMGLLLTRATREALLTMTRNLP
jgi:hypothetical protein